MLNRQVLDKKKKNNPNQMDTCAAIKDMKTKSFLLFKVFFSVFWGYSTENMKSDCFVTF